MACGELGLRVDADAFLPRAFDRAGAPAPCRGQRHDVGEVVLALLGPQRDGLEQGRQPGRVQRHHARVADAAALQLGLGVPLLHDLDEVLAGEAQPAIARRIGRPHPEHGHGGTGVLAGGDECPETSRPGSAACRRRGRGSCPSRGSSGRADWSAWPVPELRLLDRDPGLRAGSGGPRPRPRPSPGPGPRPNARGASSAAAWSTCPIRVRPASGCSTLGSGFRIRVPLPAASTVTDSRSGIGSLDSGARGAGRSGTGGL